MFIEAHPKLGQTNPLPAGFRTGPGGRLVPRNIIHSLRCLYLGEEVFAAELFPAVTANPGRVAKVVEV
ncbi:thiosulfate oxidation carrier complex protein SoxZ [Citreimonas salinaria]|uniref:thiosulfate oxidation carrier complex protein SoxZ n=1 Tax=Citreimonas salinaria TaxID=321339 RepID=UPI00115FF40A|nr:thiosulfate oxidation carrier complex protein SoxZ [Citreimonas salinaria]